MGFRFTAERFANARGLVGYVKNTADGRVEIAAEGEEKTLKEFIEAVRFDLASYIDTYSINWFPATGEFKRFEIRFY